MASAIEWTDDTWNPVRGCALVSAGCTNCYAMRQAHRFSGEGRPYEGLTRLTSGGPVWTGAVRLVPEKLDAPLRWRKPRRVFVNSMSDLFHPGVPFEYVAAVFGVMAATPRHTYQVLTKRPERMAEWFAWYDDHRSPTRYLHPEIIEHAAVTADRSHRLFRAANEAAGKSVWPLPNVWLGVSVEDQATADERIPHLLDTPAVVRFLSCEPLLGPIDLERLDDGSTYWTRPAERVERQIGWVIVGGESGHGARWMHPDWARGIRDQCIAAGVPFHFKQWGAWSHEVIDGTSPYLPDLKANQCVSVGPPGQHTRSTLVGKKAAGRTLDGRTWNQFPEARNG